MRVRLCTGEQAVLREKKLLSSKLWKDYETQSEASRFMQVRERKGT